MGFAAVVGGFYATSLLVLVLGWTGWARRAMQRIPPPIVMAIVAGVFRRFALDISRSLHADFAVAGARSETFFALSVLPRVSRFMPPNIGALLAGARVAVGLGRFAGAEIGGRARVQPVFTAPVFSAPALIERVIPFAITIVVVQRGQGLAVLTQAGHRPPLTAAAIAVGERGLRAATFTRLMLAAPKEPILTPGRRAMPRVLLGAFATVFKGPLAFGARICFEGADAGKRVMDIGAAFCGLVAGMHASPRLERESFAGAD